MANRPNWTCITVLSLLFTATPCPAYGQQASPEDTAIEAIQDYVQPFADAGHLSGTLLMARGSKVLLERSYGMANYELGVRNTPLTRFCVASITKPMTRVLAAQLIEEGEIDRKAPISTWMPAFPRGDAITVQHLLEHRSGLPHRVTRPVEETVPLSAAAMADFARGAELLFEPGARTSYSSAGYSVLARVLELATGQSYGALLDERLFGPADMQHSAHADHQRLLENRATSYVASGHSVSNAPLKDLSYLVGAGSVYSTPRDLYRMLRALLDGKLGEEAKRTLGSDVRITWSGITNHYRALLEYDRETDLVLIFAGNVRTPAPDVILQAIPALLEGEEPDVPGPPRYDAVELSAEALRGYEGTYGMGGGRSFETRILQGGLLAGDRILVPIAKDRFFCPQDYAEVVAVRNDRKVVEQLEWILEGGNFVCPRLEEGPDE